MPDETPLSGSSKPSGPPKLVEHYFRHEYGRLVSLLTRSLGIRHLELAEDVVQSALSKALLSWARQGIPNDPSAWLYRTSRNLAIDAIRHEAMKQRSFELTAVDANMVNSNEKDHVAFENEIGDEGLRLLFLSCHPAIAMEQRIAFALRVVGGFSTDEIASAFLISHANAEKRITRAKEKLRDSAIELVDLTEDMLVSRIDSVQSTIYLLFNEGYSASGGNVAIRADVCDEAIRLARMLNSYSWGALPSNAALLALMLMHSARFRSRMTDPDVDTLLADQNRKEWDWHRIREAMDWMARSAVGSDLSRYHIEAAIAWEHCRVESFESIDWNRVTELYRGLISIAPGPMVHLNFAIAISYSQGPEAGLKQLVMLSPQDRSRVRPWWDCAVADAYIRQERYTEALAHLHDAYALANNASQRKICLTKIENVKSRCSL